MKEKHELVKGWLLKADHDLEMAVLALEHKPGLVDAICFHCQQAVEKHLKALLVSWDIEFEKSHSLGYLLDLLNDEEEISDAFYGMLEKLEDYAVDIRYPDEHFEITPEDAREACEIAKLTKEFVLDRIDRQKSS